MTLSFMMALVAPMMIIAPAAYAEDAVKPDFSEVKSLAAAEALAAQGKLVKILLFPAEFGGEDIPQNVVYVTHAAADAREIMLGTLMRLVREGVVNKLDVKPEYRGTSFVPIRILITARHRTGPGSFVPVIEVW